MLTLEHLGDGPVGRVDEDALGGDQSQRSIPRDLLGKVLHSIVLMAILVVIGFRTWIAGSRYFGLALLAIALGKVVLFDLQGAGRGYRILSFLGLGALLLMTSVVYGKLSPKLLATPSARE